MQCDYRAELWPVFLIWIHLATGKYKTSSTFTQWAAMKEWPNRLSDAEMKYHDLLQSSCEGFETAACWEDITVSCVFVAKPSHWDLSQKSRLISLYPTKKCRCVFLSLYSTIFIISIIKNSGVCTVLWLAVIVIFNRIVGSCALCSSL